MTWPVVTLDGIDYYSMPAFLPVDVDPTSQVGVLLLRPEGGVGVGVPAVEDGAPGVSPNLGTISVTELLSTDPTAASGTFSLASVGPPPVYNMVLSLHAAKNGADGLINEVQTVTITGAPAGGTFTLTFNGQTTSTIAYNAAASAVQTALQALSTIGSGNVAVLGGPGPGTPYTVTFVGTLANTNVAQMTAAHSFTGGTAPAIAVTTTVQGGSVLDPQKFTSPVFKKILRVNTTLDGFELQSQLVGDRFVPASIVNTPSGNSGFTLCSVGVGAQDFDWRPAVSGQCVITGTGADVQVDLIARLNNATAGNEVGRAFGQPGVSPPTHVLSAGPPAGSGDSYDRVSAGASATIYLRAERQSGAETFTTSGSTTRFCVRVCPIL